MSAFGLIPRGLNDPRSWRKIRWVMSEANRANGRRKCRAAKRVSVALSTEGPPQIHGTTVLPT